MNNFPLHAFLASLAADDVILSVRDYDRLLLAFQTGGPWTLVRLKHVLTALLAKDEDQQRLIARKFDRFFDTQAAGAAIPEFDIRQVLEELKAAEAGPPPRAKTQLQEEIPRADAAQPEAPRSPRRAYARWLLGGVVLVLLIGLGLWKWWLPDRTLPQGPVLQVVPRALDFRSQLLDTPAEDKVVLTNTGDGSLTIDKIVLSENASTVVSSDSTGFGSIRLTVENFELNAPALPGTITLQAGGELPLTITFTPQNEGEVSAEIKIIHDGSDDNTITLAGTGVAELTIQDRVRLYKDVAYVKNIGYEPLKFDTTWRVYAAVSAGLLLLTLAYGVYVWRLRKGPQDKTPEWDEDAPKMFHPGTIGGAPQAWLDRDTLSELADSMGYFRSRQPGKTLNVAASIKATVHQGGIPTCDFHARKHIRTLLILEDANAEALDWNPVPGELAAGMRRYGIPIIYGQFRGSPEIFRTLPDGHVVHLEDLEDQRRGILLLLFTDGKSFYRPHNAFALEAVARWPMIAWMELRERRFWDETLSLPRKYNMPIFPATRDGVLQAIRSFLTERGTIGVGSTFEVASTLQHKASQIRVGSTFEVASTLQTSQMDATPKVEPIVHVLGDALPWAQACAMIQPITDGLANALRREFYPQVPPEQIECLYALPNTTRTEAGLRFSDEVLKVLRRGFLNDHTEEQQQAVLQCVLDEVEKAKPDVQADSLEYFSWEALRERVRLELDADDDLQRFGELLQTPLAKTLGDSLANFGFPDQPDTIPLRTKPTRKDALQRLAQVDRHSLQIGNLLSWGHRFGFGALVVLLLVSLVLTTMSILNAPKPMTGLDLRGLENVFIRSEIREGEQWFPFASAGQLLEIQTRVPSTYRVFVYGNGYYTSAEFEVPVNQYAVPSLGTQDVQRPCLEEYPGIGLTVQSCPELSTVTDMRLGSELTIRSWKEQLADEAPAERLMSIGLEVSEPGISIRAESGDPDARDRLLETGSVDVYYRLQPETLDQLNQALQHLERDLEPWLAQSQLLRVLIGNVAYKELELDRFGFQRILNLTYDSVTEWAQDSETMFTVAAIPVIDEVGILAMLLATAQQRGGDGPDVTGSGAPIVLSGASAVEGTDVVQITEWKDPITDMEFVRIPGDCFIMGSPDDEEGRDDDEGPQHEVCLDAFWMGKFEVTNAQYRQFKSDHDSGEYEGHALNDDAQPAVLVSWEEATAFAEWLTEEHKGQYTFRLPSEAEWEYAARASTETSCYWGDDVDLNKACQHANVWDETAAKAFNVDAEFACDDTYSVTAPVGQFLPNVFGVYDMLGNVWEWCADWYRGDIYQERKQQEPVWNPIYTDDGQNRVLRGGSWYLDARSVRSANRFLNDPADRLNGIGFRLVRIE